MKSSLLFEGVAKYLRSTIFKKKGTFCMRQNSNNIPFMVYQVLDKDTIRIEILPYLSEAKREFQTTSCLIAINHQSQPYSILCCYPNNKSIIVFIYIFIENRVSLFSGS